MGSQSWPLEIEKTKSKFIERKGEQNNGTELEFEAGLRSN